MKKSKYLVYILFLLLPLSNGCKETLPTVTTSEISDIETDLTSITATGGGNITNEGSDAVIARGVCWNTTPGPTTANSKTTDGSGLGSFTSTLTGLSSREIYFVRAYATNSAGTSYGDGVIFTIPEWVKYSGNPVLVPGSSSSWDREFVGLGSVIYYNSKYHMWYTGGSWTDETYRWRIGHATSDDGITWTKDPSNPILDKGSPGSWEDHTAHAPQVMVVNSTFHMWYTGHKGTDGTKNLQIGHATSTDGTTWTKDANNPVLTMGSAGAWDEYWICVGSVLYDGTKYHLWYMGSGNSGIKIGHATSSDGLTWTKDPSNPVLSDGGSGSWDFIRVDIPVVLFDGTTFHMWYAGGSGFNWKIGHATSTNGTNWSKDPENPVLSTGSKLSWDSYSVACMSVLDASGKYKMWYFGSHSSLPGFGKIGYAEKPVE